MIKKLKLKVKLALMTIIMAMLPFASSFACPCDGTDDMLSTTQTQENEAIQARTRAQQAQIANSTTQAEAASTDSVSDAGMSSDSPFYN